MTIETKDDLVDFVALAAQLTNEQLILASSRRIEELLEKLVELHTTVTAVDALSMSQFSTKGDLDAAKKTRAEQLDALIPKDATSGRKGAQAQLAKGFSRK
jgi:hypothetical protein